MTRIGFVGLGHMGLPMAINLIKAGHQVTGYDLQKTPLDHLSESGGSIASNIQELAQDNEVIITMLQTGEQVLHVCLGEHGLFNQARQGTLFIDCSTIDPHSSHQFHQQAKNRHFLAVDAPVSGGVAGATAATLTFMIGGEESAFHAARPILENMGHKCIHAGKATSGQVAKICNNMILGISMVAVSEAFVLADKLGLTAEKLFEVVTNSSGQCWAMSKYAPVPGLLEQVPANNEYKPGFAASMMLKDLLLSQKAAQLSHSYTPLGAKTTELYQRFIDDGLGEYDFSAIIKLVGVE